MNRYYNPVRTTQGTGCLKHLPQILQEMNLKKQRVLLVAWSETVFSSPVFSELQRPEGAFDVKSIVFEASNPTVEQLFDIYQKTKDFSPDVVVAIGGGSTMDIGKSLCCLYDKEIADTNMLRDFIQSKNNSRPTVRWIGIPTTAGTGSEVTCWATIWDPVMDKKHSIENHKNYAYAALVDPQLTEGMPLKLAVSSALDAVCHAVESYWAKATNCVSRALALQAIRIIMGNLDLLLSGQKQAQEAMTQGSMLAGLAFSNTKTTACHSISYPLTMHYGIPHGAAVSMLLAPMLEINAPYVDGIQELFQALGVTDSEMLKHRVCDALKRSGQPISLQEWGVQQKDLPRLAKLGFTKGRADNNPVEITSELIQTVLEQIYIV